MSVHYRVGSNYVSIQIFIYRSDSLQITSEFFKSIYTSVFVLLYYSLFSFTTARVKTSMIQQKYLQDPFRGVGKKFFTVPRNYYNRQVDDKFLAQ